MLMFDFLVKQKIAAAAKKLPEHRHSFINIKDIKCVLILYSFKDWEFVKPIVRDLEKQGKKVMLWTVEPKRKEALSVDNILPVNARTITPNEISWTGALSPNIIQEFSSLSYDTLFDLTTEPNDILLYLLLINTAKFCIGIKELDYKVYNFILLKPEEKNLEEIYNEIKFYLNNIS